VLSLQTKGQLQNKHEQKKETKQIYTQTKHKEGNPCPLDNVNNPNSATPLSLSGKKHIEIS
jgi:hypothetical protein